MPRDVNYAGGTVRGVPDSMSDAEAIARAQGVISPRAAGEGAMRREWLALSPFERAIVGFRGATRSLAGGVAGLFGDEAASAEFERERPALEAMRGTGFGVEDVTAGIPSLAVPGRWVAGTAGEAGLAALQAPPGQKLNAAVSGAIGSLLGQGGARVLSGGVNAAAGGARSVVESVRRLAEKADDVQPVTADVQLIRDGSTLVDRYRSAAAHAEDVLQGLGERSGTAERLRLSAEADRLGLATRPGNRWGNEGRRQLEASLASNPLTSGAYTEQAARNSVRYAELASRAIGENASELTPRVLDAATTRLGATFAAVGAELDEPLRAVQGAAPWARFMGELDSVRLQEVADFRNMRLAEREGEPLFDAVGNRIIEAVGTKIPGYVDTLQAMAGRGMIDGRTLMGIRSSLVDEIVSARAGRGTVTTGSQLRAMGHMVDAIDNLIVDAGELGGAPEVAAKYAVARTQWRVLQALQEGKAVNNLGEVSAKSVDSILRREYPLEYRRGRLTGYQPRRSSASQAVADFFDATRWGANVETDVVANSGTATRMFIEQAGKSPEGVIGLAVRGAIGTEVGEAVLRAPSGPEVIPRRAAERVGRAIGAEVGFEGVIPGREGE
jgi:hypothetical protein